MTPLIRNEKVAELLEDEGQRRVTREYTGEAVAFIEREAKAARPFFLYLPHTAMHVPIFPHQDFVGSSRNGVYGDWVKEVDWSVGEVLKALKRMGVSQDTLVIFTSDNVGPGRRKEKWEESPVHFAEPKAEPLKEESGFPRLPGGLGGLKRVQ